MAVLLGDLEWMDQPLVAETSDPEWEEEVISVFGGVPGCLRRTAAVPWLRRAYFDLSRTPTPSLSLAEFELAGFVTAQENACRYCYGVARTRMRMLGFTEEMVERIERSAQLAEADPEERELVRFCRNLARSKPRPSREARKTLESVGYSPRQTVELAWVTAAASFCNRVSTLLAMPPEYAMERDTPKRNLWDKLKSWLPRGAPPVPDPPVYPAPTATGILGELVGVLEGTPAAAVLEGTVQACFNTSALPRRTICLVFAVISHTLGSSLCAKAAAEALDAEGFPRPALDDVLRTLGSRELDNVERRLLPWARDTVWLPEQPKRIQEKTLPLTSLGDRTLLEAVGVAALANSCVRLAMLLE
jgi:AhpD family alkylhydroperoxidase